jgi:hypothetical protein
MRRIEFVLVPYYPIWFKVWNSPMDRVEAKQTPQKETYIGHELQAWREIES